MKPFLVFLILIMNSAYAQDRASSGNEGGNGGDVVVCKKGRNFTRPILLDYFEAGYRINFGTTDDAFEKVRFILKRVAKHDPVRSRLYEEGLKNFQSEVIFHKDTDLSEINDEGHIMPYYRFRLTGKCIKQQAVIQKAANSYEENFESWDLIMPGRYLINKNLWDKLDSTNKAGLVLHELMVRESVNLRHTKNTNAVRKLNRYWSSIRVSFDSQSEYEYKLHKLGFDILK